MRLISTKLLEQIDHIRAAFSRSRLFRGYRSGSAIGTACIAVTAAMSAGASSMWTGTTTRLAGVIFRARSAGSCWDHSANSRDRPTITASNPAASLEDAGPQTVVADTDAEADTLVEAWPSILAAAYEEPRP